MKTGKISKNDLYKEMRKYYTVEYALELIDASILEEKYELTEEQNKEITDEIDAALTQYARIWLYRRNFFTRKWI